MLGLIKHVFEWDIAGAELEFQRALKLSPGSADVYLYYSLYLSETGRSSEAIASYTALKELDPATPVPLYFLGNLGYSPAGRFDEAIDELNKALEMDPNFYYARSALVYNYAYKGMYAEAVAQADKLMAAQDGTEDPILLGTMGWVYAASGRPATARKLLDLILALRARRYVDVYVVAIVHAGLGDKDKAFEWLNRGYEERACGLIFLKTDPAMKTLRSDPRYKDLLKRMGWER